mgnify:CR=1 FL=1|tara:strand:+ start:16498 stop:16872 length:375 start_codon:yes stop_codon:yes gene_type:complete
MECKIEWKIKTGFGYAVTAKAWTNDSKWNWNVYAHINKNHSLFTNPEEAKDLPFHGGCTFDEYQSHEPSGGIIYDFQKVTKILVVGSDYAHLGDDYDNHPSGLDGVPFYIMRDCEELISILERG